MRKMKMTKRKIIIFLLTAVLFAVLCGCSKTESKAVKTENKGSGANETAKKDVFAMDTVMTLTAYGENAQQAVDEAEKEIKRLDALLSIGIEDSEISIVNENGSEYLSDDTAFLVNKSIELHKSTKGAFDITVYPLMEEWGFTTQKYKVPDKNKIKELQKNVDASKIEFDINSKFISLPENIKIDLGGIAKGYTSDQIMKIFEKNHVAAGMVSLGGNVQVYKTKTDGTLWKVAVENPDGTDNYLGVISVKDKAVITSGGYERYFEKDGKTYHHIIDPATGYPAESGLKSVTIVSGDGVLADGLSTSLFVMGKEKALEYWKKNSDKFDMVLETDKQQIIITKGIEENFTSDFDYDVME